MIGGCWLVVVVLLVVEMMKHITGDVVTRIDAKAEVARGATVPMLSILVSDSLSLLLKTARIAAEVEIIGAFLGVSTVVGGVGVVIEVLVGEVVEVEVVGFGGVVLIVPAVSVLLAVSLASSA